MPEASPRKLYDCAKCPAYCCSYRYIHVTARDIARIARHFGLTPEAARAKHTKQGQSARSRALRHKSDAHYGTVCRFLDPETRACRIYHARPAICRDFPGTGRCGYYDFLSFERRAQGDPDYVATTS